MKLFLTTALLVGAITASQGQGLINFANGSKTKVNANTVAAPTTYTAIDGANAWLFELFVNADTTVSSAAGSGWVDSAQVAFNTAGAPGLFSAGTVALPTAAGFAAGKSVSAYVVGWSANAGTSYSAFTQFAANPSAAYWTGTSGVATPIGQLGDGGAIPAATLFNSSGNYIRGFNLSVVPLVATPEPGTLALAGLGAAAMLIFRRRK